MGKLYQVLTSATQPAMIFEKMKHLISRAYYAMRFEGGNL